MPSTQSTPATVAVDSDTDAPVRAVPFSPEEEAELRQAVADIESGSYLELTPEQLDELVEKGTLPELEEWLALPD